MRYGARWRMGRRSRDREKSLTGNAVKAETSLLLSLFGIGVAVGQLQPELPVVIVDIAKEMDLSVVFCDGSGVEDSGLEQG